MRYILLAFLLFSSTIVISNDKDNKKRAEIDQKVHELILKMTLEEKVGQMTQVALELVSKDDSNHHEIDDKKLEDAILKYHVGSILNVFGSGYTVEHWHEIITKIQDISTKRTRLKIPVLYGIDAIHGANYTLGATVFPQPITMAASWDIDLLEKEGAITAYEVRASGIPWNFYPVMDIGRQPLWPRLWETFGEDVYLASDMGKAYINGLQGNDISSIDKVAACLKHYIGYSFPLSGKDRTPAYISERMLREYFLPPFQKCIESGAPTIMVNSSEIDGIPGHCNKFLLTDVLRGELGFKGVVVSDWIDIKRLYERDRVATSPKEAVRMAVMAGIDMSMVPLDYSFYDLLLELAKEGSVPVSRIDEAVSRILRVKYELGQFDNPYPDKKLMVKFACDEFTEKNIQAARETITLLKNENNILPLSKKTKVVVMGPAANSLSVLNGGWTITWQGDREDLFPKNKLNIHQAIESKIGKENVQYFPGTTFDNVIDIPTVIKATNECDVAIVCIGEKPYCETPGNIDDLSLSKAQEVLVKEIIKTGKPIVLALVEGRPRIINSIVDGANAILMAYLPGMEGGRAIADILFGDVNPCGKLPITYPRFVNAIMPYDHKPLEEYDGMKYNPQFPFGFGLSYTTFDYTDLKLNKKIIEKNDNLLVTVKVKNTGKMAGKEIVQLYLTDLYGSVSRPVRQIKGFTKIYFEPGQEKEVILTLKPHDLSFIGIDNKRIIEPGEFIVTIDKLSEKFIVK